MGIDDLLKFGLDHETVVIKKNDSRTRQCNAVLT